MATWDDLKEARLRLRDPGGAIDLAHVATQLDLPSFPARQTVYRTDDNGAYLRWDEAWLPVDLVLSDARLNNLIDLYGVSNATARAINFIIAGLYERLQIVRMDAGTENIQYQTISDSLAFYKELRTQFKDDAAEETHMNTGRYLKAPSHTVGGGMEC